MRPTHQQATEIYEKAKLARIEAEKNLEGMYDIELSDFERTRRTAVWQRAQDDENQAKQALEEAVNETHQQAVAQPTPPQSGPVAPPPPADPPPADEPQNAPAATPPVSAEVIKKREQLRKAKERAEALEREVELAEAQETLDIRLMNISREVSGFEVMLDKNENFRVHIAGQELMTFHQDSEEWLKNFLHKAVGFTEFSAGELIDIAKFVGPPKKGRPRKKKISTPQTPQAAVAGNLQSQLVSQGLSPDEVDREMAQFNV